MGKLQIFLIRFSTPNTVFFPGSVISGDILIQLSEPMQLKAVRIKFVGRANVHWTTTTINNSGRRLTTTTRRRSAKENLLDQEVIVFGEGSSTRGNNSLSQGRHSFPFNFQLPSRLPPTYKDDVGHISYHVQGSIVKRWKSNHNTSEVEFTVLHSLDLNTMPNAMAPIDHHKTIMLCCFCCKTGPISVEFTTDRSAYVPGESILVNVTVRNQSNGSVRKTTAHLVQTISYHAKSATKSVSRTLATITGETCAKYTRLTWTNEKLHIPPVPPSLLDRCKIIQIAYYVQFKTSVRKWKCTCWTLNEVDYITIGNIPLRNSPMPQNQPQPDARPAPSAPLADRNPVESGFDLPAILQQ